MLAKSSFKASTNHLLKQEWKYFLQWVSAKEMIAVSKAMLGNAWGTLGCLNEEKRLLLAFSAWRPGTHSTVFLNEELHWRKCRYGFVAKPGLISWGVHSSAQDSLTSTPDPE